MKFICGMLLALQAPSQILAANFGEPGYGNVPENVCSYYTFSLNCNVTQKINDKKYGMLCDETPYLSKYAILKTNGKTNVNEGPYQQLMKHVGKTKVTLENGFSHYAEIWEQCFVVSDEPSDYNEAREIKKLEDQKSKTKKKKTKL
jgi:hypothetical protein